MNPISEKQIANGQDDFNLQRDPGGEVRATAREREWPGVLAGVLVVLTLGWLTNFLTDWVPQAAKSIGMEKVAKTIEFPVYAVILGFGANAILSITGLRRRMVGAFRTEFFIKTGLVLLGASINFAVVVRAAGPAVLQAVFMISAVFGFTWWLSGVLKLDTRLRALLSSAVSICGVSAAIAAAGSVNAKKEQLAYTASLVILFAVPSIFVLPWLSDMFGLPDAVAGAWIGGNIDTTAAVSAAGAIAGERALQIATIVKVSQNALLGVVAVLLTTYFAFKVERSTTSSRPSARALWERFPKFVLGFIAASVAATLYGMYVSKVQADVATGVINDLRNWFLILAFVSIGLEFEIRAIKEAGWKPLGVFAAATVFNLVFGLGLAWLLFTGLNMQ